MARQTQTVTTLLGPYPTLQPTALSLDVAMTAANATDFESASFTGREILIWHNTGVTGRTVTIESVADGALKRTGDVTTYAVGAGLYGAMYLGALEGWRQSGGLLYFKASHADVKFGVLRLPS
jgi:hypothetical protein